VLKVRVIPTLLWKDIGLVKGVGFDSWRRVGTAMPAVKVYNTRDVDELILLDISATAEDREPDFETIAELAAECFVPLTVGGGVRDVETVRKLLRAGADKVVINSAAYDDIALISEAALRFGAQCLVACIDARRSSAGEYECVARSATLPTRRRPDEWARELERRGAGEILIQSVESDGTLEGYDVELTRSISRAVSIPVIASGGAGKYLHMYDALVKGGASAVAAAAMFHFTEQTPAGAKAFLAERGIPVRDSARRGT
jgi:cyclase